MSTYQLKDTSGFLKTDNHPISKKEVLKQFNIRIHKVDLEMIQKIAEKNGVSRSYIVNEIIDDIIYDFLENLGSDSYTLLIRTADVINNVKPLEDPERSWFSNMHTHAMLDQIHKDIVFNQDIFSLEGKSDLYKFMAKNIKKNKDDFLKQAQEKLGESKWMN